MKFVLKLKGKKIMVFILLAEYLRVCVFLSVHDAILPWMFHSDERERENGKREKQRERRIKSEKEDFFIKFLKRLGT